MKPWIILLGCFLCFLSLSANDLTDLEAYRQMKAAQELFQDAYDAGDFDQAMDYAQQVRKYAEEVQTYLNNLENRPAPPEPSAPSFTEYEVVRGDTLWDISAKANIYNSPWLWRHIYQENKHVLKDPSNPDLIHAGMIFQIPDLSEVE